MNETTTPPPRPEAPERQEEPIEPGQAAPAPTGGWAPPRGSWKAIIGFVAILAVGVLLVLYAWSLPPFRTAVETTDNANVRGQTTIIAPQVNGYVTTVPVRDYEQVQRGDVLARIDDRIYRQRVEQARANLAARQAELANAQQSRRSGEAGVRGQEAAVASAEAQLARARADMRRVSELVEEGSVSLRERDQVQAALSQAEAAVRQARAQQAAAEEQVRSVEVGRGGLEAAVENAQAALRLAEIDLSNTLVRAPEGGLLGEVGVRTGQYVTAGSQLMFLVPPQVWVIANFKEGQTARMMPGQPATIGVDALDGAELPGRVERLAPAAGNEFSVIPQSNATGNFVKVAQRISVRIAIDADHPLYNRLRPGMSVEARVDTSGGPGPGAQ